MWRILLALLCCLAACSPLAAQEWYACEEVFSGALLSLEADSPLRGQRCRVVERESVHAPGEMTLRIIQTENYRHGSSAHFGWAMEALRRSARHYARFYDGAPEQMPRTITVVFSGSFAYAEGRERTDEDDRGVLGTTHGGRTPRKCVIALYEGAVSRESRRHGAISLASSEQELKLTIAHEMFHCVQYAVARQQFARVGSGWWVEGSAEYMQHEVFPEYPIDPELVNDFDQQIPSLPIFQMKYENVVFFAFLASAQGLGDSRAFVGLFRQMPTVMGHAAQRRALASYPNINTLFQRFAEEYRNQAIVDPGGRPLHSSPFNPTPVPRVDDGAVYEIGIVPWTINPAPFLFPSGTNWKIETIQVSPPTEIRAKLASGGTMWKTLPMDVLACAGDQKVHVLATVASADDAVRNNRLIFRELRGDARDCPCPLGPWTISREDIDAHYMITSSAQQLALGARRGSARDLWNLKYASGEPLLYFNRDGTAEYSANLLFSGPAQSIQVPAACSSDDCARACAADRMDRRICVTKRRATQQVKIRQEASIRWSWRARAGHLLRTTTQVSGKHTLYINSGFGDRAQQMPVNTGTNNATADNVFRCVGKELIIENTSPRGGASSLESMIAQLAAGTARQRDVASAAEPRRSSPSGTESPMHEDILRAIQANPNAPAYPFTGRFVRP